MDFTFTDDQEAVSKLAGQIFAGRAGVDRVKAIEATPDRFDRELWAELAKANLLGLVLPEDQGGSGLGLIELCLLLEQQGRFVAPVPTWATLALGALPIAEFGTAAQRDALLPGVIAGEAVLTAALNDLGEPVTATRNGDGWILNGFRPTVPAATIATRVLVPAVADGGTIVALVDPHADGVRLEPVYTTNREQQAHLQLEGVAVAAADVLGDASSGARITEWTRQRATVGLCALQVGVAEAAVQQAANYSSNRVQFNKPLSTFQGSALKAADAYIDTEAMRVTLWQAAWKLSEGQEAAADVAIAKWWASEGGHRVVHVAQHLHGGIGSDIDYPIHRYFLWGKQIEDTLGGASQQQARLGRLIAEGSR